MGPFPDFLKSFKCKRKREKKNLGKDLVEIFAALLMLKIQNFVEGRELNLQMLLMLLLKKYGRNFFQKAKYQGKSFEKKNEKKKNPPPPPRKKKKKKKKKS